MSAAVVWDEADRDAAIASYLAGMPSTELGRRYRVSHVTMLRWLRVWGVRMRTLSEANKWYVWNEDFFASIECEAQAYWLGFLTADGCVGDDGRIGIGLQAGDRAHLEALRDAVGGAQKIWSSEHEASITFCSPHMASDLARWGVVPRKSLVSTAADVPDHLARHYWRGVVDGDGCISPTLSRLTLVGSKLLLVAFRDFCHVLTGKTPPQVRPNENIFQFAIHGGMALAVLRHLYDGASVVLERKQATYLACAAGHTTHAPVEVLSVSATPSTR